MQSNKVEYLLSEYIPLLRKIDPSTKGQWGKLNVQQMVEHMTVSFQEGNGKIKRTILTPPENLQRLKDFMMSEKEFRPNTKNSLMGDDPAPVRNASVKDAIDELEGEIKDFVSLYGEFTQHIETNPFFGDLNFEEWTQLLHKHALHHLKQFGVAV